jgi:predicted nucleotidyltransferase
MDKKQAIDIAKRYIELIKNRFSIQDAILFGSFAKKTNQEDSDIDVAIILKDVSDIIDAQIEMMKLRRKIDLRIEPHPIDSKDFNRNNPLVDEIIKYGIKL